MDHGELGRKLLEIRKSRKMTQREVAKGSPDLTPTGISRIERGERYPTLLTLEELARVLRVDFHIDPGGTTMRQL